MVLWKVLQAAVLTLPFNVREHMKVSREDALIIGENPTVYTDETEGVFWLQVNHGNVLHFRFGHALHGVPNHIPGGAPAGTLLVVENLNLPRTIVWKRAR